MTTVSSIASHRIERVILKYASGRNAAFTVMIPVDRYGLTWTACEAMVYVDGSSAIITRTGPLS